MTSDPERRSLVQWAGVAALLCAMQSANAQTTNPALKCRTFDFKYSATVQGLAPAAAVRIWMPVPPSDEAQQTQIVARDLPADSQVNHDPSTGNTCIFLAAHARPDGTVPLAVTYRITRHEIAESGTGAAEAEARDLAPDQLVPVGGKPLALVQSKSLPADPMQLGRALYDAVDDHMEYRKDKPGWGRGDAMWAYESGFGNCTDFHSLFISLARSEHLPSKFVIGFSLPEARGAALWRDITAGRTSWQRGTGGCRSTSRKRTRIRPGGIIFLGIWTKTGWHFRRAGTWFSCRSRLARRSISLCIRMRRLRESRCRRHRSKTIIRSPTSTPMPRGRINHDANDRPRQPQNVQSEWACASRRCRACAGCAAKLSQTLLAQVLAKLGAKKGRSANPKVLVGADTFDDAGVYRLRPDLALVQTVDFFTPIVDGPYDYGQIAATNAISDVYAMGGRPVSALNLLGVPADRLGPQMIAEILRGGGDKAAEARCAVIGGHTIRLPEPVYGMSVTGVVHPDQILTNDRARAGDLLLLTKPIGTGIATTGIKRGTRVKPAGKARRAVDETAELIRSRTGGARPCLLRHRRDRFWAAGASGKHSSRQRGGRGSECR